jgi:hypothetical protein
MRVEIRGVELPGRRFECFDGVRVGMRLRKEVVGLVPGDAADAFWEADVRVRQLDDGAYDFTGPAVEGRRGDRSIKLAWLDRDGELFRAAKLRLDRVPADVVAAAVRDDGRLVATVRLTDGRGGPTCASVPESLIAWTAGAGS